MLLPSVNLRLRMLEIGIPSPQLLTILLRVEPGLLTTVLRQVHHIQHPRESTPNDPSLRRFLHPSRPSQLRRQHRRLQMDRTHGSITITSHPRHKQPFRPLKTATFAHNATKPFHDLAACEFIATVIPARNHSSVPIMGVAKRSAYGAI